VNFLAPPATAGRTVCATPFEAEVNRPTGFWGRLFKVEHFDRVLRCPCPMCGHIFDLVGPGARKTRCPGCARGLKINEFAAEGPALANAGGPGNKPARKTTFYPTGPR
jgi:hypothetical protein